MPKKSPFSRTRKISVVLPRELIERLDVHVTSRQRSRFIANAIESQLVLAEQVAALEETAGIWTEERHPELKTEVDIDAWLRDLRTARFLQNAA